MNILLTGLPMPPQSNNCYINSPNGRGRFPSSELKNFQKAMRQWRLENLALANRAKAELVAKFKSEQRFVRVDRYFIFPKHQILGLDGTAKRLDASNRIKCLDDSISEDVLGLDDSWFSSGWCEKLRASPGSEASVTVCLTRCELRSDDDIHESNPLYPQRVPWAVAFQRVTL